MERKHEKYERLLERCRDLPPLPCAVAVLLAHARLQKQGKVVP